MTIVVKLLQSQETSPRKSNFPFDEAMDFLDYKSILSLTECDTFELEENHVGWYRKHSEVMGMAGVLATLVLNGSSLAL